MNNNNINKILKEINQIKEKIAQDKNNRKFLGVRLGNLYKQLEQLKIEDELNNIIFYPILNGNLSIGHKPKIQNIKLFKQKGITHFLMLLSKSEGTTKIINELEKQNIKLLWLPLENGNPPPQSRYDEILSIFKTLKDILDDGGNIYIHCSAGIHRTGMITYAFLRYLNFDDIKSNKILKNLRDITAKDVGELRKQWSNDILIKYESIKKRLRN